MAAAGVARGLLLAGCALILFTQSVQGTATATNGVYSIFVTDPVPVPVSGTEAYASCLVGGATLGIVGGSTDCFPIYNDYGRWSAGTGASYGTPAQNNKDIIFASNNFQAALLSIKDYDSGTVYAQADGPPGLLAYTCGPSCTGGFFPFMPGTDFVPMDPFLTTQTPEPLVTNSHATDWVLSPDLLAVTQTLSVGNTLAPLPPTVADSYIRLNIKVCNLDPAAPAHVGIRSRWDLQINKDDGAWKAWVYEPFDPSGPLDFNDDLEDLPTDGSLDDKLAFATGDFSYSSPPPAPPQTFYVYGLIHDPGNPQLPAPVVAPDRFAFWPWPDTIPGWEIAPTSLTSINYKDNAVVYWWGYNTPIELGPYGTPESCYEANTYITSNLQSVVPPLPPAPKLKAVISKEPHTGCAPSTIAFNDLSTGGAPALTSTWVWNDGSAPPNDQVSFSPPQPQVTHTFTNPGTYTVSYSVRDSGDPEQVSTRNLPVKICAPNASPTAAFSYIMDDACPDYMVQFADGSTDDDSIATRAWEFGDGQGSTDANPTHVYAKAGTYTVTLTVTDEMGQAASTTATIVSPGQKECPLDPNNPEGKDPADGTPEDGRDASLSDMDTDGDQVAARIDNCGSVSNPDQRDTDEDRIGDACDGDKDGDTVANTGDNCELLVNHDQADSDLDGVGDVCQGDADGDGVKDEKDNCPKVPNADQVDLDVDSRGDACDLDVDGDGAANVRDAYPFDAARTQLTAEDAALASRSRLATVEAPVASVGSLSSFLVFGVAVMLVLIVIVFTAMRRRE